MSGDGFPTRRTAERTGRHSGRSLNGARAVVEEVPVAFSYGGTTHAVMMATPDDLIDFAYGFSFTEGIIAGAGDIDEVEIVRAGPGIDLQIALGITATDTLGRRRRHLAGPVGCGLCGVESIEQALRPVRTVPPAPFHIDPDRIPEAVAAIADHQPLHDETHAAHAAGFFDFNQGLVAVREDVGRHNALDKLIGTLVRHGTDPASGAIVVTSRVSVEIVQKAAAFGTPFLFAVSAPTALALSTAEEAGITLAASVRGADFEVFTHAANVAGEIADVA